MTVRITMVRHGNAAGGFGEAHDPGLSDLGRRQAAAVADALAARGPLAILSSPLRRARETAQPLAERWRVDVAIEPGVAEIPSPSDDLAARGEWLRRLMAGTWSEADAGVRPWRQAVIDSLLAIRRDAIVFSHFVAINVAVGAALGDDRATVFRPDNASCTVFKHDGAALRLIARGRESETQVG